MPAASCSRFPITAVKRQYTGKNAILIRRTGVAEVAITREQLSVAIRALLDIAAWKQRYLEMYDAQIDGLEPVAGFKTARRAVIERTFDRLLQSQR